MVRRALVVLLWLSGSGLWAQQGAEPSGDVRLARGSRRCAGRLEVKGRGVWEPVLGNSHGDVWNLTLAAAACRRLNCGAVESLRRDRIEPDSDSAPSILKDFGYLDSILDESFTIEITCSESVRLVDGTDRCSGRLEVKLGQSWSPVSKNGFDQREAEVVCRQINCGAPSVQQGELFGETETPQWSAEFECGGGESALLDCGQTVTNSSGAAVELTCSDGDRLRLAGGGGRCGGILEMRHWDEWKPAFTDHWMLEFAVEVCLQLDCGTAVSTRKRTNAHRYVWKLDPEGDRPDILNFPIKLSFSSFSTEVSCSDSVRLVNGADRCSGRLEVKSEQSWSSVCAKDFDQRDAEVVCREVGCGPPLALEGAPYGEVGAPMGATEFHCEGQESGLRDCRRSAPERSSCPAGEAAALTCSEPGENIKLVGEASPCSGFPRLKHEGVWKLAMIQNYEWSLKASDFVCRLLGCGSSGSAIVSQHRVRAPAWWISSACFHNKPAFRDCVTHMDALSASTVKISCSDSVRLVNGADRCSGRLEVKSEQSWSSVCAKDFDRRDAEVVCREVGCGPPLALEGAPYGEVGAPMGATEFHCEGQESGLRDCRRSAPMRSSCPVGEAAALTCSDGLRLGGGTSRCQGVLEMENRGQWRPVADLDFVWDQNWTATVCGRLGCGVAVVTVVTDDADVRPVWWVKGGCVRPDAGLRECLTVTDNDESEYSLEVTCSDLLTPPTIALWDGVSGASEQGPPGAQVLLGSAFSIRCSAPPQYPGGLFLLSREGVQGYSRLAENHSAIFPFPPADRSHQGSYTCVLHLHLSEHNFSATSRPLSVSVGAPLWDLILRLVLVGLALPGLVLCSYLKARRSSGHRLMDANTNSKRGNLP